MTSFVLVPGAWLGGWAWRKVVPLLEQEKVRAIPITLTGMGERVHLASDQLGIETAINDVLNVLDYEDLDEVVLVGHSFAGKVVAAVADRRPEKVRIVMYVDAFRPSKARAPQGSFADEWSVDGWRVPFPGEILDVVGKDVTGDDRAWMLSKVTSLPNRYFTDPIALSENFDSIKSGYVFCNAGGDPVDEILAGKWGTLDGPHRVIDSGHWPMISRPRELADALLAVAGPRSPSG